MATRPEAPPTRRSTPARPGGLRKWRLVLETVAPDSPPDRRKRLPRWATVREAAVFLVFTVFFLITASPRCWAATAWDWWAPTSLAMRRSPTRCWCASTPPHTLKGQLSACVTPYLYGHPWLEKPALYYWRAMFLFQDFGVHDWSARLPSTTFAFIMVALIYLHMRRFRPGGHLDAALITVACAGIIGFSRGASTDMQMAAPLAIGLLGWYAWYETGSKFWLYDIYFFTGLATLAKGPVAPFLAIPIIAAFAFLRREWTILRRSLLVAGHGALLCHGAALVHRRAAPEPHLLPRVLSGAQPGALCHRPLPASAALLVLPGGDAAGRDAVDGDRCPRPDRRHANLGGRVALRHAGKRIALRQPPRRRFP